MNKQALSSYIFSVGRVRALEKFLIKEEVFGQALDADAAEALRLFAESDLYSEELLHVKNSPQLENVLEQELRKLKSLISDLLADKELLSFIELDTAGRIQDIIDNCRSEFLRDYLRHLADMHNIKTFLRLYILKEPQDALERHLIYAGFIRKEDFLKLYSADLATFLNRLEYVGVHGRIVDYAYYLREPIEKAQKEGSFISLEKAISDFLIQVLKQAKYISFGPEPVLAYYLAKVNEINLMRMIILAKFNNLAEESAKERLNNVYA